MNRADKIKGSVFGLAFGDAWGWPTEFMSYPNITVHGKFPFPANAIVTDDTQMSLYAMNPIFKNLEAFKEEDFDETQLRLEFAESFVAWSHDPLNNRAPGITCMDALATYEKSPRITGFEGANHHSKGCGANMRNPWFGLLPFSRRQVELYSVIQASVTHYHPLALSSAAVTALLVKDLFDEVIVPGDTLFTHARKVTNDLIQLNSSHFYDPQYLDGLEELEEFLAANQYRMEEYLKSSVEEYDICEIFGLGKVAEEALLVAIAATDKYENPVDGLERLVHSSGDSDSIAAIGGAFMGVKHGYQVWPSDWMNRLESNYKAALDIVVANLIALNPA